MMTKIEPLRLKAFAENGASWSFCVKEEQTGLSLPLMRKNFTIFQHSSGVLALECQIDLNVKDDKFLTIKTEGGGLSCEEGFIKLLEPPVLNTDGASVDCVIMIDGFGGGCHFE